MHVLNKNQNSVKISDRNFYLESIRLESFTLSHTRFRHITAAYILIVTLGMIGVSSESERQSHLRLALMTDFLFLSHVQNLLEIRTHEVDPGFEISHRIWLSLHQLLITFTIYDGSAPWELVTFQGGPRLITWNESGLKVRFRFYYWQEKIS